MASKGTSHKRGPGESCQNCRNKRRRCNPSGFDNSRCINCQTASIECSLSGSRTTPSADAKRKVVEIGDTPDRDSSATASYNLSYQPIVPPPKKPRQNNQARPATHNRNPQAIKRQNISPDACGICLKESISTGEKKGDAWMIECHIPGCQRWCHLSCVQFNNKGNQIFYSLAPGTITDKKAGQKFMFICLECFNPQRQDLIHAVAQAESDFKMAMERVKQEVTAEKEGWPRTLIPSPPQDQDNSRAFDQNPSPLDCDVAPTNDFEPAKKDQYQAFEQDMIESLLTSIDEAVEEYDREIEYANALFLDKNEVVRWAPLKVWDQIDPGQHRLSGKEWFEVDSTSNNLSDSHAPITAALRRMLRISDDKSLRIPPDLEELSFSQVHQALIYSFLFDILNNELNIYHFPNMKPLRATLSAVANAGEARWKGGGHNLLREVQLRAWHKPQFREEVIENVSWQGELIRRLEGLLAPMTRRIGKIDPLSLSRASIIKYTVELWSYLNAAHGRLEVIHPSIGGVFNRETCENADELQSRRLEDPEVKWVVRPGFRFSERSEGGKSMFMKARVIVE